MAYQPNYWNNYPAPFYPGWKREPIPGWGVRPVMAGPAYVGVGAISMELDPGVAECIKRVDTRCPKTGEPGLSACQQMGHKGCFAENLLRRERAKAAAAAEKQKAAIDAATAPGEPVPESTIAWAMIGIAGVAALGGLYLATRRKR